MIKKKRTKEQPTNKKKGKKTPHRKPKITDGVDLKTSINTNFREKIATTEM